MNIKRENKRSEVVKFIAEENGAVVGRAYLYLIKNDLHAEPYGLLEDVFVEEEYRGRGLGTKLAQAVIDEAKARGCYKIIATSRTSREGAHHLYEKIGFKKYGWEFRMDF